MNQVIRLSAKKLVQTYIIYGDANDNVVSMLARNGYRSLPADIAGAVEKLKTLHRERAELIKHIERIDMLLKCSRGWLPNHTTTCDDSYQDHLELLWEIRDIEDNLGEIEAEINRLKSIAKL